MSILNIPVHDFDTSGDGEKHGSSSTWIWKLSKSLNQASRQSQINGLPLRYKSARLEAAISWWKSGTVSIKLSIRTSLSRLEIFPSHSGNQVAPFRFSRFPVSWRAVNVGVTCINSTSAGNTINPLEYQERYDNLVHPTNVSFLTDVIKFAPMDAFSSVFANGKLPRAGMSVIELAAKYKSRKLVKYVNRVLLNSIILLSLRIRVSSTPLAGIKLKSGISPIGFCVKLFFSKFSKQDRSSFVMLAISLLSNTNVESVSPIPLKL